MTIRAIQVAGRGLELTSLEQMQQYADVLRKSGVVRDCKNAEELIVRIQYGYELGLTPMQSIQNISNVNGRLTLWGDLMLAIVQASPKCEYIKEWGEGEGEDYVRHIECKRTDREAPTQQSWGVDDDKRAGLWGKGTHKSYPKRMLQMRARSFGLRDAFPDVLRGAIATEEAQDYREGVDSPKHVEAEVVDETPPAPQREPGDEPPEEQPAAETTRDRIRARWVIVRTEYNLDDAVLVGELNERTGRTPTDATDGELTTAIDTIEKRAIAALEDF